MRTSKGVLKKYGFQAINRFTGLEYCQTVEAVNLSEAKEIIKRAYNYRHWITTEPKLIQITIK